MSKKRPSTDAHADILPMTRPTIPIPKRPEIDTPTVRCPRCGSTDRDRYDRTVVQEFGGLGPHGEPYTHIVRRFTRCSQCGQARVERTLENRPPMAA